MEGSGEGVAAVLRGLKDAGLVLTMVSRRVCRQDPPRLAVRRSSSTLPLKYIQRRNARVTATKKLSAPRMNSSMQTSTEPTAKVDSGAQAYDDRYISSYQIAHCKMEPTSPPGYSPEFPPQKANPCRDGHFSVGTYGCEKILPTSIRSDTVRNHSKWPDRGFFGLRGNSCQTDAFAYSLRRYSRSHPCRTKSVDLIDRLVRYRQGKNVISSKMSKSARTIPKKLTDIREDRKARRTALVQTYTRARPDIERESLETSDTIAPQAFRGWKYKKSNGTLTYDYLKPTSELYRKRRDRVADVRYMDNVSQFMRNPINSLYFNEPKVCPKLLSRYNEHIRRNHATEQSSNTNPNGKTQATRQVGCHWPSQREATMQTGGINDKSCSTAPHDSTIKNNQTSQDALTASRNRDSGFVDDTEHPELKMQFWLDELPVYPNETPEQKLTREREMKKLANTLKGIPHDEYFDDNARNEIINCLNTIPIWLPASEPERKKFKELLAQNLLQKSKNTSSGSNNTLVQIVENWVGQIPLNGNNITKKHLVEDIVNQLKPIVENMPSNKKDGVQVLEHKIDEIFKEIRTRDMKDEEVDGLVDSLVDSLMNLSKISVGQTDSFREIQTKVNEWIRDDLNNNSLLKQNKMPIEDLCGKIYGLKIIGNGNNTVRTDMGREINAFLRDVTTFKTASTIENMTEKLLKSILGNPPGDQDKTTAEKEKNIIQQVILREVDEFLNAASTRMPLGQLDVLKEEVTQMLVNQGDQIVTARFEDTTSEDEADRMIDKLLERVKGIYLGSRAMNNLIVNTILTNVPNLVSYTNIMNNIHMKFANSEKSINFNHANPNVSRLVRQFVYYFDSDKNNAKDLIMQRIAKKILSANRPLSKSESTNEGHNTVDLDLSLTGNNENVPENSGNSTINNQYTINNETFRNPLNERKLSNGRQDNVPTSLSPTQNRPLRGFHNSRASNTGRTDKSEIGRSAVVDIDSRREKTDLKNENTKKNDNKVKPFREDDTRLLHKGFDKNGSIDLSLELTKILEHLINKDISIDQTKIDILNLLDNNHSLNKTTYTDFERGIGVIDNEDKSNRAKEVCGINNKDPSKSNKRNATNNTGGSARRASKCAMVDADCSDSALNKLSNNVGTQARRCDKDSGKGMLGKVESLYDYIKMWANKLPFDESILNKEDINSLKQDFTSKMLKKINDVAANPDIFNDSSLYEDVIKDEIDSLTNEIQKFLDGDEYKLKKMKEELVDFIIEERSKTLNNLAGKAYKQQLRDAVAETIPSELDVTLKEDEISFNVLKDTLADAFINLNYSKNNEPLRNKAKKKIAKEITKFCNDYLNRHPDIPLSETELNKELYSNLNNVPLPSNESMKSEVELIRIKEVIKDWMKDLPLVDLSASEQYQQIRKISILAKTLLDLENIKNENNYALVQTDMKNEIVKWLKKMPLQLEKKSNLDSIAQDLVVVLKNTESDRKFRPSSRLSADITNSPCKDIYSACPRLPCALSIEDCKHLERIRDRTCNWKSRKARRICTDAGVGSCMDNGSQTDGKAFGCIKSVPSVCPRGFQGSAHIRRTPSCWSPKPSRTRVNRIPSGEIRKCCDRYAKRNRICTPRESCAEIQIKVKDCSWDEPECSATTRIPCKNTPQEPCSFYRNPRRLQQSSQRCGYQKKHIRPPQISTRQNFDLQPQRYRQCKVRDAHLDSYVFRSPSLRLLRSTESKFSSVRFPVEDFLETSCARESNMTSGEESAPTHGRQAKRRDRADCGWYDMDLSGSKTKARTNDRDCGHFSRKPVKNIPKSFAAQCPYPSYLYFRQ